jgi:hypothetical protein
MSSWSHRVVNTISGETLVPVQAASSGSRAINGAGSGSASIVIPSSPFGKAELKEVLALDSNSITTSRNGVDLYRASIRELDYTRGKVAVAHKDIRSDLVRRLTLGTNGYSGHLAENNRLPLLNMKLSHMPYWLLWSGIEGPTPNYGFPININGQRLTYALINSLNWAGTDNRTYWDYELKTIGSALSELADLGVETDFEPFRTSSGGSELNLRSGTLTGGSFDCNMTSSKPWLRLERYRVNSDQRANVAHAVGKGSEMDMRVRTATTNPSVPASERVDSYKDIDDLALLQKLAGANVATYSTPTEEWELSMLASDGPGIENIPLGSILRLYFKGHEFIADGWKELRLIAYSFDATEVIKLTVQPMGA